jgi:hypothetical protein
MTDVVTVGMAQRSSPTAQRLTAVQIIIPSMVQRVLEPTSLLPAENSSDYEQLCGAIISEGVVTPRDQ